MKAKDIMKRDVITVQGYLTLPELAKLLEERCISGAPVVDESGNVVGVVSQTDLVRTRRQDAAGIPLFHLETDESARSHGMHIEEIDAARVEQIMTPGAIAYDAETPVRELARAMLDRHIHRVLITRASRLCGIVSTMDMLRALSGARKPARRRRRR